MAKSEGKGSLPKRKINEIRSHTGPINALTFSSPPQQTYILTGSSDRSIHLHRAEPTTTTTPSITTQPIQTYTGAHGYAILSLSCSRSNTTFASSGGDRTGPFLWDVSTATTLRRFGANSSQAHTARIPCVVFAGDDDSVLISGSDDRSVRIWDTKSRDARPITVWDEARDGISAIALGGGHEILTGSTDGRVRTYDLRMGSLTTDVMPAAVVSLDVSSTSDAVLVGCLDSRLRLLDRSEGSLLQSFGGDEGARGAGDGRGEGADTAHFANTTLRLSCALDPHTSLAVVGSETCGGAVFAYDVLSGGLVDVLQTSSSLPSSSSPTPPPPPPVSSFGEIPNTANDKKKTKGEDQQRGKCISCIAFRKSAGGTGTDTGGNRGVWACAGVEGVLRVYAR